MGNHATMGDNVQVIIEQIGGMVQIIMAYIGDIVQGNHGIDGRQGAWLSLKPKRCGLQLKSQNSTLKFSRKKM